MGRVSENLSERMIHTKGTHRNVKAHTQMQTGGTLCFVSNLSA